MKELTCIVCPNGCELTIDEKTLEVKGNKCPRGADFAVNELKAPSRTISSTVKTSFKDVPVLPVRVSKEIPKEKIFEVMKEINRVTVDKRIKSGDVVIANVLGLNVDVIATSDILLNEEHYGKH